MPVEYKLEVYQVGEDEFDTGDFLITDEKQIESFKGVSGIKFYDIDYKQEYVELPERVYQVLSVMTDKEGYYQAVISERQKGEDFEEIEINPFIEGGVLEVE
jgi:fructose 1,6-bisphosphatase